MSNNRWYIAVLVLQSKIEEDDEDEPLTELQYRLIEARDPDAAYNKAVEIGRREEQRYPNCYGETVAWEFVGMADLGEVLDSPPADGAEVYSQHFRGDPSLHLIPKEKLSAFWSQANQYKTARELLEEEES